MKCLLVFACALPLLAQEHATHATGDDWPLYGGTNFAWRYSALDQVNTSNVKKLGAAWVFQTGDYEMGLQSTPIVIDGIIYLSTSRNWVYAIEGTTGKPIWVYKYPNNPSGRSGYGNQNRGVAVAQGLVILGTLDNSVVAIDQKTGREVWRVNIEDYRQCGCNITAAPLIAGDKVIVGGTGGDSAHRGYLNALDIKTGRLKWRFFVIPGPGEKGHETWPGDTWKLGGGAPWMTGTFDPALNLVYWGTGNASSDLNGRGREGDNLYTASIVALDAGTGKVKWHYQEIPHDTWDYDSAYEPMLIDVPVNGVPRKLMVHANKSGYAFILDRTNGQLLRAFPYVKHITWSAGMTEDGKIINRNEPDLGKAKLICPGSGGGRSWNHATYSPRTNLYYSPAVEWCSEETSLDMEGEEGKGFVNGLWPGKHPPGEESFSHIDAYDPVKATKKWTYRTKHALLASLLTTAGDLLFTGDPEGYFFALDARSGEKLWSFQTGSGLRGSPVTFRAKGRQYILTPSGWGSLAAGGVSGLFPADGKLFRGGSALFAFALPEETK